MSRGVAGTNDNNETAHGRRWLVTTRVIGVPPLHLASAPFPFPSPLPPPSRRPRESAGISASGDGARPAVPSPVADHGRAASTHSRWKKRLRICAAGPRLRAVAWKTGTENKERALHFLLFPPGPRRVGRSLTLLCPRSLHREDPRGRSSRRAAVRVAREIGLGAVAVYARVTRAVSFAPGENRRRLGGCPRGYPWARRKDGSTL